MNDHSATTILLAASIQSNWNALHLKTMQALRDSHRVPQLGINKRRMPLKRHDQSPVIHRRSERRGHQSPAVSGDCGKRDAPGGGCRRATRRMNGHSAVVVLLPTTLQSNRLQYVGRKKADFPSPRETSFAGSSQTAEESSLDLHDKQGRCWLLASRRESKFISPPKTHDVALRVS